MRYLLLLSVSLSMSVLFNSDCFAQDNTNQQIIELRNKIEDLDSDISSVRSKLDDFAIVFFLFGIFCALWAQNTGRNPWIWFFLGLCFHIITGLVLLYKNSSDKKCNNTI